MKKLLLIFGALVVLVVVAVIAAPFLVPTETIKSQLTAQVESATGRKLTVDGDLDLSVIPHVAVQMNDVHFANAPGSDVADMVSLDELKVVLKILPLLSGAVEVSEFVLVEPKIHLEVDADGTPNWEMQGAGGTETASETETAEPADDQSGGGLPISELKLGDIRLENGSLTYVDHGAGTEEKIEAINMTLGLEDLKSPLTMLGSLDYKGETIDLDLGLTNPSAILEGDQSPFKLGVKSDLIQLGFAGDLKNQGAPSTAGDIDLSVPSVKKLAAWLAAPLDFAGEGLEQLTIAGKLNGSADRVAFTGATISLDRIRGRGEVTAELAGSVPKIAGRLDLGAVDLNAYLPPIAEETDQAGGTEAASGSGGDGTAAPAPASTDWSDEPIDMPPLDAVDLAFELTLDKLLVQELKLDRTVLALTMANNVMTADLKEFGLYDGKGSGSLTLNVADGRPTIEEKFKLTGLQAHPFLTDAAEFNRLEGTVTAEFDLTSAGSSERELVQNLNGGGKFVFVDGAVTGVNIAAMVRNTSTAFLSAEANETQKTDFAELSGSFNVERGILNNQDLSLQAPALRIAGSGTVDLPAKRVDYRIDPKAAATLEGQGSEAEVAGILVPVLVTGPFDNPTYRPDLSGVINQAINDPKALKKQVKDQVKTLGSSGKDVKKQLKSIDKDDAKDLLEGLAEGDEDAKGSPAGKLLEGLLNQ